MKRTKTRSKKLNSPMHHSAFAFLEQGKSPLKINKSLNNLSDLTKYSTIASSFRDFAMGPYYTHIVVTWNLCSIRQFFKAKHKIFHHFGDDFVTWFFVCYCCWFCCSFFQMISNDKSDIVIVKYQFKYFFYINQRHVIYNRESIWNVEANRWKRIAFYAVTELVDSCNGMWYIERTSHFNINLENCKVKLKLKF